MESEDLLDSILRKRRCMGRGGKEGTSPPGKLGGGKSLSLEELRALKERQGTFYTFNFDFKNRFKNICMRCHLVTLNEDF